MDLWKINEPYPVRLMYENKPINDCSLTVCLIVRKIHKLSLETSSYYTSSRHSGSAFTCFLVIASMNHHVIT